jgi:hypothetical protein
VPDILGILEILARREIAFVVIGGVAVAHHGYMRSTKDVDIVPEPTDANLRRLWQALLEMAAHPLESGDFRADELPTPFNLEGLLQLGNWALMTRYGRLDILQYVHGKLETPEDYDRLEGEADELELEFGAVLFAGYDDLIDFKNVAGRDQDLTDIRALREARGEMRPGDSARDTS